MKALIKVLVRMPANVFRSSSSSFFISTIYEAIRNMSLITERSTFGEELRYGDNWLAASKLGLLYYNLELRDAVCSENLHK